MRIGVDGAALNQGLFAGIYNVTVQLLNEMAEQRPQHDYTMLVSSREIPEAPGLFSRPNVNLRASRFIDRPNARMLSQALPVTNDAEPHLLVNGAQRVAPISRSSHSITFTVDRPCRSLVLASRAIRPSDAINSLDGRRLGIGINSLEFQGPFGSVRVDHHDPRLSLGFHGAEAAHRWTNGAAVIPRELFEQCGVPLTVTIGVSHMMAFYFVNDETVVEAARGFYGSLDSLSTQIEERFTERMVRGLDVFHSHHFAPRIVPGAVNIATAYDIIPILHPEHFGADAVAHFQNVVSVFRRCDRVFCISEATRRDLITRLNFHPDRVVTAPIDCDAAYRRLPPDVSGGVLARYGLAEAPYAICVGTIEPRKGHARVVEAFTRFRQENPGSRAKLAIIGKRGWHFERVFAAIDASPVREDILYLDYVPIEDLVHLYNRAHFAAYLSSYEGFGLPILEALACGIPVVTSNVSSMPEVAGSAGLLVRPDDVSQIADAFRRMFTESGLRDRLAAMAPAQRAQFSWKASAQIYLEHIEDLARGARGAA